MPKSKQFNTISFKIPSNILFLCDSWITVSVLLLNTYCPSHAHSQLSKISYLSLIATFNKSIQLHPILVLAFVPSDPPNIEGVEGEGVRERDGLSVIWIATTKPMTNLK